MASYQPLVYEYRGKLLDLTHMGYMCIVDENSNVIFSVGSPEEQVFYRSASKPLQALPVIARDLDDKFGLTEEESTIFAGSHTGDTFHVAALESIYKKTDLKEEYLCMNPALPQVWHEKDLVPRKFYHNCSGKHTGAMLIQRDMGGEVRDYWKEDSLAQTEIKRAVAVMSEYPVEDVTVGLDGCGVPVFAVGMKNIAVAFKNLACPDKIKDDGLRYAAEKFVPRIHKYNRMMRGIGYLCSMINEDADIVAKGGANAVYGLGLKNERLGLSIKLADGKENMWPFLIAEALKFMGHKNDATYAMLEKLCPHIMVNDNGTPCGSVERAFEFPAR